jgi:D-sedoheptulose 7-phosphate isomerase
LNDNGGEYISAYFNEVKEIIDKIDQNVIVKMISLLEQIRNNQGRLFILGVGGGAGNASHAVNDFRKITGIECYTPTDNVSELTARVNDDGWDTAFANWLKGSRLTDKDGVLIFSVGGGNLEKNISVNIVNALKLAQDVGANILGIVGRDGGYTAQAANACLIIPTISSETITPHTESFQSVIWHLLVSHPLLQTHKMKWESVQ